MTHTPGPWNQAGSIIWSPQHGVICELYEPKSSEDSTIYPYDASDEAKANARLIVDAPGSLMALRAINEAMGELAAQGYFCPFCSRRYVHGPDCPFLEVGAALAGVRDEGTLEGVGDRGCLSKNAGKGTNEQINRKKDRSAWHFLERHSRNDDPCI